MVGIVGVIAVLAGIYLAGALLIRLPGLFADALAIAIAAFLYLRDRRSAQLLCRPSGSTGWDRDWRSQRALERALRSALALTEFVTRYPRQSDRAMRLVRGLLQAKLK